MNEKRNRFFSWLSILILLLTAFPMSIIPQELSKKVKELEQMITRLEQRIVKLEGIILELQKSQAKTIASSPDKWKNKANWRLLRKGMNKGEVEKILGEPPQIKTNAYYGDTWFYPDVSGGHASFNEKDILTSWSEF